MKKHSRKWKEAQVKELSELAEKYPVVAIATLEGLPAKLMLEVRKKLAGKAIVKVCKVRVLQKALELTTKKRELSKHANKSVAVIFTEMNPFQLYAELKKNKVKLAAKVGQIAPVDIIVPAGDTGLPPGPALSDLKNAGLPVKISGPTIEISKDTVVAKAGEPIKAAVASVLAKLDIKPIELMLDIAAAFENGIIYTKEVLNIDSAKIFNDFVEAYLNAYTLCLEICYPTRETIDALLQRAYQNAYTLAIEVGIYTKETLPVFLARAKISADEINSRIK